MCLFIHMYIHVIDIYTCIHIYIYRERERERYTHTHMYMSMSGPTADLRTKILDFRGLTQA